MTHSLFDFSHRWKKTNMWIALTTIFFLWCTSYGYICYFLPLILPNNPYSNIIRDTHGLEIGEILYSGSTRHRPLDIDEIPDFFKKSLIILEDRSFYENNGIDGKGILRSTIHNIEQMGIKEGASTISSQLIRNAFWIEGERSFSKKIMENIYAIRLNHILTKNEILTEYINRISYGNMNQWLSSASHYYFGKEPKNLTEAEQISLLAIPKNPDRYDPYEHPSDLEKRRELILKVLEKEIPLGQERAESIRHEKITYITHHADALPYVSDFIKANTSIPKNTSNGQIDTTLDRQQTEQVSHLADAILTKLSWRNVSDYAILIAERIPNQAPKLRVMIGGTNYHNKESGQVNAAFSPRQPGSALKPFTYALAFQELNATPETTILDLPVAYKTIENYSYEPKNYSLEYKGLVTLREALSQSINIPAVKLAEKIGIDKLLAFLHRVGFHSLNQTSDYYGLALTLGDGEVTLYELLRAYTIFSNEGKLCPIQIIEQENTACIPVIDPKFSDMIVSILTDRYAKLDGFPLDSALDFSDRNVFVKTGTSRNFRDNWSVGFTDHFMIAVWTGNKSGENMKWVSGATGAGEIFARLVAYLEAPIVPQKPHIIAKNITPYLMITSPLSGSVYRMSKTKPIETQRIHLTFETNQHYDTISWLIDGKQLHENFIIPTVGNHTLTVALIKDGVVIAKDTTQITLIENN